MIHIAIDGPAGAGKSTVAKMLAKKMEIVYVDTGAMYRAMGLYFLRNNISPDDSETIENECEKIDIGIEFKGKEQIITLFGENVNPLIRTLEVGSMASAISVYAKVRRTMVRLQQKIAENISLVMDGRDIGTVVLPNAEVKLYITASVEVRAKRRFEELQQKGVSCTMEETLKEIEKRDLRDMTREESPLRQAEDAIYVDTSEKNLDEVLEEIEKIIKSKVDKNDRQ